MKPTLPYACSRLAPDGALEATAAEARAMADVWRRYASEAIQEEERIVRLHWAKSWDEYRVSKIRGRFETVPI